jgi:hypothetical protein
MYRGSLSSVGAPAAGSGSRDAATTAAAASSSSANAALAAAIPAWLLPLLPRGSLGDSEPCAYRPAMLAASDKLALDYIRPVGKGGQASGPPLRRWLLHRAAQALTTLSRGFVEQTCGRSSSPYC